MIVLLYMENNPFITLTPIYFLSAEIRKQPLHVTYIIRHLYKELNESTEEGSESYPNLTSK